MTTPTGSTTGADEMILDSEQCARVALYMYQEWEKDMQPPLYVYKQFPEWLQNILDTADKMKASALTATEGAKGGSAPDDKPSAHYEWH